MSEVPGGLTRAGTVSRVAVVGRNLLSVPGSCRARSSRRRWGMEMDVPAPRPWPPPVRPWAPSSSQGSAALSLHEGQRAPREGLGGMERGRGGWRGAGAAAPCTLSQMSGEGRTELHLGLRNRSRANSGKKYGTNSSQRGRKTRGGFTRGWQRGSGSL